MLVVTTRNIKLPNIAKHLKEIQNASYETYIGYVDGATYPDGKSVAYIAYLNEYGGHNPPRPFLQRTAVLHYGEWAELFENVLKSDGVNPNSIYKAHKQVGIKGVGDVKKTISEWNPSDPRPNKPSTIRRKARRARGGKGLVPINPNTVLIDSGVMISRVSTNTVKK